MGLVKERCRVMTDATLIPKRSRPQSSFPGIAVYGCPLIAFCFASAAAIWSRDGACQK